MFKGRDEVPTRCRSYLWPVQLLGRASAVAKILQLRLYCSVPCWFRPSSSPLPFKCSRRCPCLSVCLCVYLSLSVLVYASVAFTINHVSVSRTVSVSLSVCRSLRLSPCVWISGLHNKPCVSLCLPVCLSFSPSQSLRMDQWPSQ